MNDRAKPGSKVTSLTNTSLALSYNWGNGFAGAGDGAGWFGPLAPMPPVAPPEVAGRVTDFESGYNLQLSPRPYEPIKFSDLRSLADGYDILRLVIETRKDQMERLAWKIQPKTGVDGKPMCKPDDARIKTITKFFEKPDGKRYWGEWVRILLEDMFVIDAATLYKRRLYNGSLFALEVIDGATIKRVIDNYGRTPDFPLPAYQQILKGFPAVDYTVKDLLYLPRNQRSNKFYGYGPVEQVIMSVNIALRRELFQLQYYTEGNMPEALVGTPDLWTPDQIQRFQNSFDSMLAGNQALRRRLKFIPGGVAKNFVAMKEPDLTGKQDEWLARVVCFCFSISPQPFVSMMNRATAETAHDSALEEGLAPTQNWIKRFADGIIEEDFNSDDIEFAWVDDREVDPKDQSVVLSKYVEDGIMTVNEARDQIGQAPVPGGDTLRVKVMTGFVPIDINDDMPTAGEQAKQDQANTEQASKDKAEALKNGVQPNPDGSTPAGGKKAAKTPADGGAAEKAAGTFPGQAGLLKRRLPPPSHNTPAVTEGENALEAIMNKAFKKLLPVAVERAKHSYHEVAQKLAKAQDESGLDWAIVVGPTTKVLTDVAQDGAMKVLLSIGLADDESIVDHTFEAAAELARDRAAEMVGMKYNARGELVPNPSAEWRIDETTRDKIKSAVEKAIEEGLPAADLGDAIEATGAFSTDRALMIARTEIIRANNMGHLSAFRASGVVDKKEWSTAQDELTCPVCTGNQDQGPIPLEEEFESGDLAAPAHPNCRCVIVPIVSDTQDSEE